MKGAMKYCKSWPHESASQIATNSCNLEQARKVLPNTSLIPGRQQCFRSFPWFWLGTLLRNWLQVKSSKKWTSIYQQFKVHEASAFLSIVLDIWSPQSALDIDNHTSCHPENRKLVHKFVCPSPSTLTKEEQCKGYEAALQHLQHIALLTKVLHHVSWQRVRTKLSSSLGSNSAKMLMWTVRPWRWRQ